MITAICQECNNQFEYELKPGFPRKYCNTCKQIKKQQWEDMQKPEVVKIGEPVIKKAPNINTSHTTMYVSYAKDIFCALIDYDSKNNRDESDTDRMRMATDLVKQAQEAFS